ncbi:hypothetical protein BGZ99_006256 [Dissophora globulifera]|uniref:Uncharacterized protein n=1 Tax=Dissophora globulifera TaxID=979702 RepID=A0A9P6RWT4_9FUNG|nr:hypothetical protein BGZ99_006256 [Dissophora globulifera]
MHCSIFTHATVLTGSKSMVLRGAYTADGETYHVTSRQHYSIQKRADDRLPLSAASDVVIYRDSDLLHPRQFNKRGDYAQILSCGTAKSHNNASGNASTSHGYYYPPPLISQESPAAGVGWSRIGSVFHFDSLKKRDDPVMIKITGPNPIPSGCPTDRVVNFIGVAADCTYVRAYGGLEGARKQIFADFNTASGIYESTFNVALGIVSMQIQSMNCPSTPVKGVLWNQECSVDYTINDRLSDFSFWRGQSNRTQDGAGLWHLLTNCKSGSIVGLAWTKSLCEMDAQAQGPTNATEYTSGTGVSSVSPNEWMVVAHEIGHGFGASHDCTSSTCVSAQAISDAACCPLSSTTCDGADNYIMNPEEQAPRTSFSPCSINAICSTIASQGQCLQPPTARVIQQTAVNVCGNGIVEEGEQCDCGSPDECAKDPCCDGSTCKFKGSAVCDDRQDDCCRNCQFAPLGQVCRSALSDCDITETCNGTSAICPPDELVADLTPCQIVGAQNKTLSQGQCASGYCTSRDYQCAQLQRPGITRQCPSSTTGCELLCNDPSGAVNMREDSWCVLSGWKPLRIVRGRHLFRCSVQYAT